MSQQQAPNLQQLRQVVNNLAHDTVRQYIDFLTNVQYGFRPNLQRLRQDNLEDTWEDLYTDYITEDNDVNRDRQLLVLAILYAEVAVRKAKKKPKQQQHHHDKNGRGGGSHHGGGGGHHKKGGGHNSHNTQNSSHHTVTSHG